MKRLVILTANSGAIISETISGAFSVADLDGGRLSSGNFFTLEEAAEAGLKAVLRQTEDDDDISHPDGTVRPYVAGDLAAEQQDTAICTIHGRFYSGYAACPTCEAFVNGDIETLCDDPEDAIREVQGYAEAET